MSKLVLKFINLSKVKFVNYLKTKKKNQLPYKKSFYRFPNVKREISPTNNFVMLEFSILYNKKLIHEQLKK